jgi:hypothetical protein
MVEIQRYWSHRGVTACCPDAPVTSEDLVLYHKHLADKKAALEAQAEEHGVVQKCLEGAIAQRDDWQRRFGEVKATLDAKPGEFQREYMALRARLKSQHTKELAEVLVRVDYLRDERSRLGGCFHYRAHNETNDAFAERIATCARCGSKELAEVRAQGEPALIQFEHPNLIGEPCMIHRDFMPAMQMLGAIAEDCDVQLHITHSMRRLNQKLVGAIVEAAERSNHHGGSAVDLNVVCDGAYYTSKDLAISKVLKLVLGHPVKRFILAAKDGPNCIRWGGSWSDPVHFDDNLVLRDPDEWARRVKELQDA